MSQLNRLYVLVREDLGPSYAGVQAGHAVAQHMLEYPALWRNQTLVYLRIKDESKLIEWRDKLLVRGIPYAIFREPDLMNEATALAVLSDGTMFKNLKLL
jgi:hypothetical protein